MNNSAHISGAPIQAVQTVSTNELNLDAFARIEGELLDAPGAVWVSPPLKHLFSPGIYIREIHMPAGMYVLGAQHRTDHFNIIMSGRVAVFMDGAFHQIVAPCTIRSGVDVRKFLLIEEDTVWQTIHANPDDETDVKKLEDRLFTYTPHYKRKLAEWELKQQEEILT